MKQMEPLSKTLGNNLVIASLKGLLIAVVFVWLLGNPLSWFQGRYEPVSSRMWTAYWPAWLNPKNRHRCEELAFQFRVLWKIKDELEAWPILFIAGSIGPFVLLRQRAKRPANETNIDITI